MLLGNTAHATTLNTTDSNVFFGAKLNNQNASAEALTINAGLGNVTFTGTVGDAAKIAALEVNSAGVTAFVSAVDAASVTTDALGSVRLQGGRITTTGAQTFNDDVLLGNTGHATTLNTTDSNVFFGAKLNNQTASAEALTINAGLGNVTFTGTVGDAAKIAALEVNSAGVTSFVSTVDAASVTTDALGSVRLQGGRITTTGAQTFNDDVLLGLSLIHI